MKRLFLLLCCYGIFIANSQSIFKADIRDLHFMAGKWSMIHEWGDMEENWGEPMGNNMICSYRCVKDGKVVFYEFIVIEQSDSVPVMKLRHFNPGSIGWEEKEKPWQYPLVSITKDKATFERPDKKLRMNFWRKSAEELLVTLERQDKDGKWKTEEFPYTLKH